MTQQNQALDLVAFAGVAAIPSHSSRFVNTADFAQIWANMQAARADGHTLVVLSPAANAKLADNLLAWSNHSTDLESRLKHRDAEIAELRAELAATRTPEYNALVSATYELVDRQGYDPTDHAATVAKKLSELGISADIQTEKAFLRETRLVVQIDEAKAGALAKFDAYLSAQYDLSLKSRDVFDLAAPKG